MRAIRPGEPCRASGGPRSASRRASNASMPIGRSGAGQRPAHRPGARRLQRGFDLLGAGDAPGQVDQRPGLAAPGHRSRFVAEQSRRMVEQPAAARARVEIEILRAERFVRKQRRPPLLHRRQLGAAHAGRQDVPGDGLEHRLRRRRLAIELLQRFPPPGEPDPADHRVAAGGEDRTQSDVKTPQGLQCGAAGGRDIGQGQLTLRVHWASLRRHRVWPETGVSGRAGGSSSMAVAIASRDCLEDMVGRYREALAARDASSLPLAPNLRFTENAQTLTLSEGLWGTATGVDTPQLVCLDPVNESAGFFALAHEHGEPVGLGVRLKLSEGAISEIETIVARPPTLIFDPDGMKRPGPGFGAVDPAGAGFARRAGRRRQRLFRRHRAG